MNILAQGLGGAVTLASAKRRASHNRLAVAAIILLALSGCKKAVVQPAGDQPAPPQAVAGAIPPSSAAPDAGNRAAPERTQAAASGTPTGEGYATAKRDFVYGPGRPLPRLQLPPLASPGPLADAGHTPTPGSDSPCGTALAAAALDIGPRQNQVAKKAKAAAFGAFSKLLGFGGANAGDSGGGRPRTDKNPLRRATPQQFHDQVSDTDLSLVGKVSDEGLLLNTRIDDAPDKSTFHQVYVEDRQCRRYFPDRYLNYKMWLEWSLSVSWTRTRTSKQYQNDELVSEQSSTKSGGYFKTGTIDLDQGRFNLAQLQGLDAYQQQLLEQLPPPIWQQMGFSSPESGVRSLGSQFNNITPAQLAAGDSIAVVHVTRVVDGRYVTRGLPFKMEPGADGLVKFTRL